MLCPATVNERKASASVSVRVRWASTISRYRNSRAITPRATVGGASRNANQAAIVTALLMKNRFAGTGFSPIR